MSVEVLMELTTAEAVHLAGLLRQFLELLDEAAPAGDADPAMARLAPDAYPDDAEASHEFRSVTRDELLTRRRDDARRMLVQLASVTPLGIDPASLGERDPALTLPLGRDDVSAWLRTLTALRLVIASRLGIDGEDDHDPGDPRYGIYDWLGFRLDALVRAIS